MSGFDKDFILMLAEVKKSFQKLFWGFIIYKLVLIPTSHLYHYASLYVSGGFGLWVMRWIGGPINITPK